MAPFQLNVPSTPYSLPASFVRLSSLPPSSFPSPSGLLPTTLSCPYFLSLTRVLYRSPAPSPAPTEENHLPTLFVTRPLYRKDFFSNSVLGEEDPHWRAREAAAGSEYGWRVVRKKGDFTQVSFCLFQP